MIGSERNPGILPANKRERTRKLKSLIEITFLNYSLKTCKLLIDLQKFTNRSFSEVFRFNRVL